LWAAAALGVVALVWVKGGDLAEPSATQALPIPATTQTATVAVAPTPTAAVTPQPQTPATDIANTLTLALAQQTAKKSPAPQNTPRSNPAHWQGLSQEEAEAALKAAMLSAAEPANISNPFSSKP
jgi:hypothetical protein